MRHGKKIAHLGRKTPHRKYMLANMACSLIEHKSINTTVAKAKALKQFVEPLIINKISDELDEYDAFVIACYSDPGLNEAKQIFKKPIYGIHETSVKFCTKLRHNFGVIALGDESIQRHINYIKALNLESYYIGENALNISVNEAVSDKSTFSKIIISGRDLIEKQRVEMIILGCAGLAKHRAAVERELGVKVIDPVQTSVEVAVDNLIN